MEVWVGQENRSESRRLGVFFSKKSQKSKGTVLAAAYIVEARPSPIP